MKLSCSEASSLPWKQKYRMPAALPCCLLSPWWKEKIEVNHNFIYEIKNFRFWIQRKYFPDSFFSWKAKNQTNMNAWVLELWMAWVFIFIWNARSTVMKYIYLSWLCFYSCSPLALFPLQKWPTNHVLSEGKWDV